MSYDSNTNSNRNSSYVDNCFVVEAAQIDAIVDTDARQLAEIGVVGERVVLEEQLGVVRERRHTVYLLLLLLLVALGLDLASLRTRAFDVRRDRVAALSRS